METGGKRFRGGFGFRISGAGLQGSGYGVWGKSGLVLTAGTRGSKPYNPKPGHIGLQGFVRRRILPFVFMG